MHAHLTQERGWQTSEPPIKFSNAMLVIVVIHAILILGLVFFWLNKKENNNDKKTLAEIRTQKSQTKSDYSNLDYDQIPAVPKGQSTNFKDFTQNYQIQPGDTLARIASKFGVSIDSLLSLNRSIIKHKNHLEAGKFLMIPLGKNDVVRTEIEVPRQQNQHHNQPNHQARNNFNDRVPASRIIKMPTMPRTEPRRNYSRFQSGGRLIKYQIQRGDTLYEISKKFGVNVNRLIRMNRIRNPHALQPGTAIYIPEN